MKLTLISLLFLLALPFSVSLGEIATMGQASCYYTCYSHKDCSIGLFLTQIDSLQQVIANYEILVKADSEIIEHQSFEFMVRRSARVVMDAILAQKDSIIDSLSVTDIDCPYTVYRIDTVGFHYDTTINIFTILRWLEPYKIYETCTTLAEPGVHYIGGDDE